ncbi:MAG: hypothetical protein AAFZ07_30015, partial [Actinomycetota bacterium]
PETSAGGTLTGGSSSGGSGERYVILAVERNEKAEPMSMRFEPRRGDEATVAIHVPDREEALRLLDERGWWALPERVDGEDEPGDDGAGSDPD